MYTVQNLMLFKDEKQQYMCIREERGFSLYLALHSLVAKSQINEISSFF